jgi:hypothetical protein
MAAEHGDEYLEALAAFTEQSGGSNLLADFIHFFAHFLFAENSTFKVCKFMTSGLLLPFLLLFRCTLSSLSPLFFLFFLFRTFLQFLLQPDCIITDFLLQPQEAECTMGFY